MAQLQLAIDGYVVVVVIEQSWILLGNQRFSAQMRP
jgi:hypothetical protein